MKVIAIIALLSIGAVAAWTGAPGEQGPRGAAGATGITGSIPSWAGATCPAPTFLVAVAPNGTPDCRDLGETTFSPPLLRSINIPLTHFRPLNDELDETTAKAPWIMRIMSGARVLSRTASTQAETMNAVLPLPHGAVLRSVSCRFNDTVAGDATNDFLTMKLMRTTAGGVVTYCGTATTVDMGIQTLTLDEPGLCSTGGAFSPALHASETQAYTTYSVTVGTTDDNSLLELRRCAATFDVSSLLP